MNIFIQHHTNIFTQFKRQEDQIQKEKFAKKQTLFANSWINFYYIKTFFCWCEGAFFYCKLIFQMLYKFSRQLETRTCQRPMVNTKVSVSNFATGPNEIQHGGRPPVLPCYDPNHMGRQSLEISDHEILNAGFCSTRSLKARSRRRSQCK